jgi:hypothetical protein
MQKVGFSIISPMIDVEKIGSTNLRLHGICVAM